jgi:hypothetical protein
MQMVMIRNANEGNVNVSQEPCMYVPNLQPTIKTSAKMPFVFQATQLLLLLADGSTQDRLGGSIEAQVQICMFTSGRQYMNNHGVHGLARPPEELEYPGSIDMRNSNNPRALCNFIMEVFQQTREPRSTHAAPE